MVSLMNGLSSLGAGVSAFAGQAGLELQKSQLADQQAVLADQLATTRETKLEGQRETFQTGLQGSQQTFQAQQTAQTLAAEAARQKASDDAAAVRTGIEQSGADTRSAAQIAAERALETQKENAPTETARLLRDLGYPLPGASGSGGTASGSSAASSQPGPRRSGGIAADGSVVPPMAGASPAAAGTSGAASGATPPVLDPNLQPLLRRALGQPEPGSEPALRMAIAQDVNNDPVFKYKTVGQRATEVENRVAIAKGTMISPQSIEENASAIANYQMDPVSVARTPGAANIMARVMEMNPQYNAANFSIAAKTRESLANGPLGVGVTAANTVMQHANEFRENAAALNNGRIPAFNWIANTVLDATGSPRPLSLQETVAALASEARKVYAGTGGGTQSELDSWEKNFPLNGSPAMQNAAMKDLSVLLRGRLTAVADQINNGTPGQKTKLTGLGLLNPDAFASYQRLTAPSEADALSMAQDAIARGAPRDAVLQRLRQNGIDPKNLIDTLNFSDQLKATGQAPQ